MSKKIISLICVVAILSAGALTYYLLNNKKNETDAERFSKEYTQVSEKNVFVYKNASQIVKILENGTGVVFLGFADCQWCQAYAPKLHEVVDDLGIEKVFYCDIKKDREDNTEDYQKIVSLIGDGLLYDDEGNHRVYVPDVTVVKDGKIIGHDNESSTATTEKDGTPSEYWTKEKSDALKNRLQVMLEPLIDEACNSCE